MDIIVANNKHKLRETELEWYKKYLIYDLIQVYDNSEVNKKKVD